MIVTTKSNDANIINLELTLEDKLKYLKHSTIKNKQLISDDNEMLFDVYYKLENDDEDYIDTGFISIESKNKIHISIDGALEIKIKFNHISFYERGIEVFGVTIIPNGELWQHVFYTGAYGYVYIFYTTIEDKPVFIVETNYKEDKIEDYIKIKK